MNKLLVSVFFSIASLTATFAFSSGLHVCNETGERISVAYASYENGVWISRAWHYLTNTSCTQLASSFSNTRYYLYAVGDSGKEWGANHPFCLPVGANYAIGHADNTGACWNVKNFFSVWIPDMLTGSYPDKFVYTFSGALHGASNSALNHPRAER